MMPPQNAPCLNLNCDSGWPARRSLCVLLAAGLALVRANAVAASSASDEWQAKLEADWMRQLPKRFQATTPGKEVSRDEDAAGAVDGIRSGKWGFHTENERNPWWQVDLGQKTALDRIIVYNRCDGMAARNSRIIVSVSNDGQDFRRLFQHDGSIFFGHSDQKPLTVVLAGAEGRFVRLSLEGISYFHLDEVEIHAVGDQRNIALGRPATQSSTSPWSARSPNLKPKTAEYPIAETVRRGLQLASSQRRLIDDAVDQSPAVRGVAAASTQPASRRLTRAEATRLRSDIEEQEGVLNQVLWLDRHLATDSPEVERRALYLQARGAVRRMTLANPLLNFDSILFVKRAPGMLPHMSDQHYGWWSRPGGGIYVLEGFKTGTPRVRCLTADMPPGSFIGPDLSHDGRRVLFAYCRYYPEVAGMEKVQKEKLPEDSFYHVYEMNVDGSSRRPLSQGRYDDFDPRYLPGGDIVFLSTRKSTAIQCTQSFSDSTRFATLPDSYVRCGGDSRRPCAVFTLHAMDERGMNLRPLSAFENFEWTPAVATDGRLLYSRWDYIDRFNGHFESLWSANQDGTNPQLVYGNYTVKPQAVFEARSIPGSSKLVFTACAHHSITGGSLCLLDRNRGTEGEEPLTRLTPDVCFPETEGSPEHYYANPWPLSEEYFLVGWADQKLPPHAGSQPITDQRNPVNAMGIYLYDAFGNLELLHRDPEISSMYPVPLTRRPKPANQPVQADWAGAQEGRFLIQNVAMGLGDASTNTIRRLRIVAVTPKVQPYMNQPVLGVSAEDPGKFVLGTVPVEADGSAYFRVPSGVPVFFQALDSEGIAVQTMRTLTYVQPGQQLSCIGCHEYRESAPATTRAPLAMIRAPSRITPGPEGSWPLRFDRLVQPVLDRHCVRCHRSGSEDADAAKLDLVGDRAYTSLIGFGGEDLKKLAFERDQSIPGQGTASNSKLWKLLTQPGGHKETPLDADSLNRLATWMDTYAHRQGHFSAEQEQELESLRNRLGGLLTAAPAP